MTIYKSFFLTSILSFFLVACATPSQVAQESRQKFDSMTLQNVMTCVTVEDDQMSSTITFSSYNCFRHYRNDSFVRAYKNKQSGRVSYQIYTTLISKDWSFPYAASYLMPLFNGERKLQEVEGNRLSPSINDDIRNCGVHGCTLYEHFTFPLERRYLQSLSYNYDELSAVSNAEKFRIFKKAGEDHDFVMNINELVGVYRLVESWISQNN